MGVFDGEGLQTMYARRVYKLMLPAVALPKEEVRVPSYAYACPLLGHCLRGM